MGCQLIALFCPWTFLHFLISVVSNLILHILSCMLCLPTYFSSSCRVFLLALRTVSCSVFTPIQPKLLSFIRGKHALGLLAEIIFLFDKWAYLRSSALSLIQTYIRYGIHLHLTVCTNIYVLLFFCHLLHTLNPNLNSCKEKRC